MLNGFNKLKSGWKTKCHSKGNAKVAATSVSIGNWKTKFCFCVGGLIAAGMNPLTSPAQQQNNVPLTAEQQAAMQSAQQQNFDQLTSDAEAAAIPEPQQPFANLSATDQQYLDQFLEYWQSSSENVKQYVCQFQRFEYDSGTVNYRDPTTNRLAAAQIATGEIRYAEPDRGFYETSKIWSFKAPPAQPGGEADYEELKSESSKEKWICDGRNIYEFDFENKVLYEAEIPAEMQGERIIDSPLPFLFGAKKDQILQRYWVRVVPQNSPDEYWLEAYPKRIEDARMYSKIEVILAKEDFLPKAIHVYSPQYDPAKGNFQSRYFAFENRKINSELARFQNFMGFFVRPQTPILGGWKRVTRSPLHDDQQAALPTERK